MDEEYKLDIDPDVIDMLGHHARMVDEPEGPKDYYAVRVEKQPHADVGDIFKYYWTRSDPADYLFLPSTTKHVGKLLTHPSVKKEEKDIPFTPEDERTYLMYSAGVRSSLPNSDRVYVSKKGLTKIPGFTRHATRLPHEYDDPQKRHLAIGRHVLIKDMKANGLDLPRKINQIGSYLTDEKLDELVGDASNFITEKSDHPPLSFGQKEDLKKHIREIFGLILKDKSHLGYNFKLEREGKSADNRSSDAWRADYGPRVGEMAHDKALKLLLRRHYYDGESKHLIDHLKTHIRRAFNTLNAARIQTFRDYRDAPTPQKLEAFKKAKYQFDSMIGFYLSAETGLRPGFNTVTKKKRKSKKEDEDESGDLLRGILTLAPKNILDDGEHLRVVFRGKGEGDKDKATIHNIPIEDDFARDVLRYLVKEDPKIRHIIPDLGDTLLHLDPNYMDDLMTKPVPHTWQSLFHIAKQTGLINDEGKSEIDTYALRHLKVNREVANQSYVVGYQYGLQKLSDLFHKDWNLHLSDNLKVLRDSLLKLRKDHPDEFTPRIAEFRSTVIPKLKAQFNPVDHGISTIAAEKLHHTQASQTSYLRKNVAQRAFEQGLEQLLRDLQ